RVVEMHPQEKGLVGAAIQPLHGMVHVFVCAAFGVLQELLSAAGLRHLVVVNGETMIESKALLQHRRRDEGGGVPTALLEEAGEGRRGGRKNESSGIPHLVGGRVETREDAGVRGRS